MTAETQHEGSTSGANTNLQQFSSQLAAIAAQAAGSIVRVDDGSRLTATGLIWSSDGLIVTTSHGVERDENVTIEQADGTTLPATIIGRDNESDIALLRVTSQNLTAVQPASEEETQIGNLVLALARPGQAGLQATLGIISSRQDSQRNGKAEYILHTDAVLYPGSSGGALVTMSGRVAGMTNLLFGRGKGIAVGTSVVANVVEALLAGGKTQRGYLGISTQQAPLPANLRASLFLAQENGLLVVQVEPGTGAEKGGLFLGDVLLSINGQTVSDVDTLRQHLRPLQAGQTIDLQILRGGELREMQVALGSRE